MTDRRKLIEALVAGDGASALDLLGDAPTFHSPVRDYRGREAIAPVWEALVQVVEAGRVTSLVEDGEEAVAAFTARAGDRPIDGVVRAVGDPIADVTLFVRPLGALLKSLDRMAALLA